MKPRVLRFLATFAATALLTAGLTACGGGGGGGGGFALPPANPMALTVAVNGAEANADGAGAYAVKPGDKVEIIANQATDWSSASSVDGAISLRDPGIDGMKWSAQIVNATTQKVSYTITAKASANAALAKDVVLQVAPADERNGDYKVFAANGTEPTLALNFDTMSYDMKDQDGGLSSGLFSADTAEPGTYVFSNSRITGPVNAARFRVTTDAVVGGFPLAVANSSPTSYEIQPFIAARSFVTTAAELDGVYNRFSVYQGPTPASSISSLKIENGGTKLVLCKDEDIPAIDACPAESQQTFSVAPSATPALWEGTSDVDPGPNNRAVFYMARIGGQNVYLQASYSAVTTERFLRVGLMDTPDWPAITGYGPSTKGTWGRTTLNGSRYTRTSTDPDGTTDTFALSVGTFGGPQGIRSVDSESGNRYFAMQSGKLSVVVGARNPNTAGYMAVALID